VTACGSNLLPRAGMCRVPTTAAAMNPFATTTVPALVSVARLETLRAGAYMTIARGHGTRNAWPLDSNGAVCTSFRPARR
jgi:hypothetical protein